MQQDFWTMEHDKVLEGLGFFLNEEETINDEEEEIDYKNEYTKEGDDGWQFINHPDKATFIWEKFDYSGEEVDKKKFLTFSGLIAFLKKI